MSDLVKEAALELAARGFAVLPLRPLEKEPMPGSRGFYDATTDPERIELMFNGDQNIAVGCGASGVWVLDVDKKSGGYESLKALRKDRHWPKTAVTLTANGGKHYWFRTPPNTMIKNSASKIAQGIDVRGENGYAVVPPSRLSQGDSQTYRWASEDTPEFNDIADAPAWLIEEALAASDKRTGSNEVPETIPENTRNDTLISIAGSLRRIGFSEDEMYQALAEVNRQRCRPPMSNRDVRTVARSASRYERGRLEVIKGPEIIHWGELHKIPRPLPLVKNLLNQKGLSVVYGQPGVMKSFVALDLAVHVACGRPWHGNAVERGRVLYIAGEGYSSINDRLEAACRQHGINREGHDLEVCTMPDMGNLERFMESALPIVNRAPYRLVIVDTLNRALQGGNENSPEDMGAFISCCDFIRRETDAHVTVVHHEGKDSSKGARGHSSLKAAVDTEINVTKDQQAGICNVEVTKQKDMPDDFSIAFRWVVVPLGNDDQGDPITSLALQADTRPVRMRSRPTHQAGLALDCLWQALEAEGVQCGSGALSGVPADLQGKVNEQEWPSLRVVPLNAWRRRCDGRPLSDSNADKAFSNAKLKLIKSGHVAVFDEYAMPAPDEQNARYQQTVTPF